MDYLVLSCFSTLLVGVVHRVGLEGYSLQLTTTMADGGEGARGTYFLDAAKEGRVDGVVIIDYRVPEEQILALQTYDVPCVLVDRQVESGGRIYSAGIDNRKGMMLATSHLLDLGHTRIGCVVGPLTFGRDRTMVDGYRSAIEHRGIRFDPSLVWSIPERPGEYMATYLGGPDLPTGFVTSTNEHTATLIAGLMRRNLRVPDDVSVVGYGGEWEKLTMSRFIPDITTVDTPLRELGELAVEMVIQAFAEGKPRQSLALLEPELLIGSSTAPPKPRAEEEAAL
jgi:LacI family transcriptional regulator